MNTNLTPARAGRLSALSVLFARYVSGQITDAAWAGMMQTLDEHDATAQERLALAYFFRDALDEVGGDAVSLPRKHEVEDMLAAMRSV